jgi:peroxiredoxin
MFTVLIGFGLSCALIVSSLSGCKKKTPPAETTPAVSPTAQPVKPASTPEPQPTAALPLPGIKLTNVIANAKSWTTKEIDFSGPLPEVSFTDIEGKTHNLSDMRGKNVLLAFWATWCPQCNIDDLGQLRNEVKTDDLAILAVSVVSGRNPETAIRAFVKGQSNINFPVIATTAEALPNPLNQVEFLPCNFFIDAQGKVKLVTEGPVSNDDIKAILRAR